MIQMLLYNEKRNQFQGKDVVVNTLHVPESLDSYDIDIINLQDEDIWRCKRDSSQSIDLIDDFTSLSHMITSCKNAKIIILFPQNYIFKFSFSQREGYCKQREIKDMLGNLNEYILKKLFFLLGSLDIIYENNNTVLSHTLSPSAFCLQGIPEKNILTTSDKSNKITTAYVGKVIVSTIRLDDYEGVLRFLREINLYNDKENYPEWMHEIKMFNDLTLEKAIQEAEQEIIRQKQKIDEKETSLQVNQRYESILYTSGSELVEVIYEILGKMLGCDLSDFEDKHKEDFRFEIDDMIFIGEIKGISTNVQSYNVAQLDIHVQEYKDEYKDEDKKIIALLIINHQRNKPLTERTCVHNDQIKLAKRNGSLIVETITLLRLFEQYLCGKINTKQCLEIFRQNNGLLVI